MTVSAPWMGCTLTMMGGVAACTAPGAASAAAAATSVMRVRIRGVVRASGANLPSVLGWCEDASRGLPARFVGADLAAAGPVPGVALQQCAVARVRQLVRPVPGLLPAAVDDADLRGLLGLGPRTPRDGLRVVLRGAGVPGGPEL